MNRCGIGGTEEVVQVRKICGEITAVYHLCVVTTTAEMAQACDGLSDPHLVPAIVMTRVMAAGDATAAQIFAISLAAELSLRIRAIAEPGARYRHHSMPKGYEWYPGDRSYVAILRSSRFLNPGIEATFHLVWEGPMPFQSLLRRGAAQVYQEWAAVPPLVVG